MMNPGDSRREQLEKAAEAVFGAALDMTGQPVRRACVDRASANNEELRREDGGNDEFLQTSR